MVWRRTRECRNHRNTSCHARLVGSRRRLCFALGPRSRRGASRTRRLLPRSPSRRRRARRGTAASTAAVMVGGMEGAERVAALSPRPGEELDRAPSAPTRRSASMMSPTTCSRAPRDRPFAALRSARRGARYRMAPASARSPTAKDPMSRWRVSPSLRSGHRLEPVTSRCDRCRRSDTHRGQSRCPSHLARPKAFARADPKRCPSTERRVR